MKFAICNVAVKEGDSVSQYCAQEFQTYDAILPARAIIGSVQAAKKSLDTVINTSTNLLSP